ncbi:PhzF family phenazine biosynthesis protein [Microbulbifer discodermiae]|uniref:PhzF family phenazine biosynthesis protein n=1 Tax=Microbulbifer sp. 2201CG32-9 TaxID=3232309 RepID=UPI00345C5BA8
MRLPIFQADAFTAELFGGNPAALVPLEQWLPDDLLQQIATENQLSETAFTVPSAAGFQLRWFTPASEVPLCGHATLAAAHLLWTELGCGHREILFSTLSGELRVQREKDLISMDFPAQKMQPLTTSGAFADNLKQAFGCLPRNAVREESEGGKLLLEFAGAAQVAALKPDMRSVAALPYQGVVCTATGDEYPCDFVSRFFAPNVGIDEDPVTGSAHTLLTPYWAEKLDLAQMQARQISARGGVLECQLQSNRVILRGRAVTYMRGEIRL